MRLLSIENLSAILHMNTVAIMQLVNSGKVPYKIIKTENGDLIQFELAEIKGWLPHGASYSTSDDEYVIEFKKEIENKYPEELKKIKEFYLGHIREE
jgi:hypothetical protein